MSARQKERWGVAFELRLGLDIIAEEFVSAKKAQCRSIYGAANPH